MFDQIGTAIKGLSKIAGVELILLPDDSFLIHYCIVSVKKGILVKERSEKNLDRIDQLAAALSGIPVSLLLNGRGIITKHIREDVLTETEALKLALPNTNPADFCIQFVPGNRHYISIARRQVVEDLADRLSSAGIRVIHAGIGPLLIAQLAPFITPLPATLPVQNHHFRFDGGNLQAYESILQPESGPSGRLVTVAGEQLDVTLLLSYAAALAFFMHTSNPVCAEITKPHKSEFIQERLFKTFSKAAIGFIFLLLLVNFLVFSSLNTKKQAAEEKLASYRSLVTRLDSLEAEISRKEAFLEKAGWSDPATISFYCDRVGASLKGRARLTQLSVNPLDEQESRKEKKMIFQNRLIRLQGTCTNAAELNGWIRELKTIEWVRAARVDQYLFDTKNGLGNFTVLVNIR